MVVFITLASLGALASVVGGVSYYQKQKTNQADIELDKVKETTKQKEIEFQRQESLMSVDEDIIVGLTESKIDDFFVFMKKNSITILSIIAGTTLVMTGLLKNG